MITLQPTLPSIHNANANSIIGISYTAFTTPLAKKIASVSQYLFFLFDKVVQNTVAFADLMRYISPHLLSLAERVRQTPGYFGETKRVLKDAIGCLDFIQMATDINFFAKERFFSCSAKALMGRVSATVAHFCGAVNWLNSLKFININKVTTFAIQTVARKAFIASYALYAADAIDRLLLKAENSFQKVHAGLDLSCNLAKMSLELLLLAGTSNVIGLGILSGICLGTSIASFAAELRQKEIV